MSNRVMTTMLCLLRKQKIPLNPRTNPEKRESWAINQQNDKTEIWLCNCQSRKHVNSLRKQSRNKSLAVLKYPFFRAKTCQQVTTMVYEVAFKTRCASYTQSHMAVSQLCNKQNHQNKQFHRSAQTINKVSIQNKYLPVVKFISMKAT